MAASTVEWSPESSCTEPCAIHAGRVLKFYCQAHNAFVCGNCLIENHHCCDCDYIPELATNYANSDEARAFKERVEKISSRIRQMTTDSSEKIVGDIQAYRKKANAIFDECKAGLVKQTYEFNYTDVNNKVSKLNTQRQELDRHTAHAQYGFTANIHTNIELSSAMATNEIAPPLEGKSPQNMLIFKRNKVLENVLHSGRNSLGGIVSFGEDGAIEQAGRTQGAVYRHATAEQITQTSEAELKESTSNTDSVDTGECDNDKEMGSSVAHPDKHKCTFSSAFLTTMGSINAQAPGTLQCDITGIDYLPFNKLIIVEASQKSIALVDTVSRIVLQSLPFEHTKPFDVACISQNRVAVTFPKQKAFEIFRINHKSNYIRHVKTVSVDGQCHGIAFKSQKLVMSFLFPSKIQILDVNGTIYKSFSPTGDKGKILEWPYYVTVTDDVSGTNDDNNDVIYVSDRYKRRVVKLSMDGEVIFTHNENANYANFLLSPNGICPAGGGNVLVCYNFLDRRMICLLSHDGQTLQRFPAKDSNVCHHPHALTYNCLDERLYVVYSSHVRYNQSKCNEIEMFKVYNIHL